MAEATLGSKPSFWRRTSTMVVLFVILSLGLNAPYLAGGFHSDDLILINEMAREPGFSRLRGVWSVDDLPAFTDLWWADEDAAGAFWRPLPSALIEASVALFGDNATPLHLLSIVLHGLSGFVLFLLVRRLSSNHLLALSSAVLWLSCEDHSMGIGWIATITDVLAVFGILVAMWSHVLWLQERKVKWLALSLAAIIVSLPCKETAVIAPVVIGFMTFFFPAGVDEEFEFSGVWARVRKAFGDPLSWAPHGAIAALFLVVYRTFELGGMNNLMYVDLLGRPLAYLEHLVLHLPVMWLATLTPVPASLTMMEPALLVPMALAGALVFAGWLGLVWPHRRSTLVVWALCTYVLALLPQLGADASERLLYFPFAAAAVIVATQIAPAFSVFGHPPASPPSRWAKVVAWALVGGVLVPGLLLSAVMPWSYGPSLERPERDALTALPHVVSAQPEHVLLLNTSGPFQTIYPGGILSYHQGRDVDVRVLSSCNAVVSLTKVDAHSFVIRTDRTGWLSNMFARLVRTKTELHVGRRYDNDLFSATILEVTEGGEDALAVKFVFRRPLSDPKLLHLRWDGEAYAPFDFVSLADGQTTTLADTSDVFASM